MSVSKELEQVFAAIQDLVMTNPTSAQIQEAFSQVAETYGYTFSTTIHLYNDWNAVNQPVTA